MNEHSQEGGPLEVSPGERLESWKDIAGYLKRDVRTVQRWEKLDGLPIYRHGPGRLGGVYAYRPELDAWWDSARGRAAADTGGPGNGARPSAPVTDATGAAGLEATAGRPGTSTKSWRVAIFGAIGAVVLTGLVIWQRLAWTADNGSGGRVTTAIAVLDWPFARASPDGRWLAYQDAETRHLWLRDLSSGKSRVLVSESTDVNFAWARDSRQLAFTARLSENYRLETIEPANGSRKVVWQQPFYGGSPLPFDWAPDGARLVCLVDQPNGERQISFLSIHERRLTPIISVPGGTTAPRLSPDGRFVVYQSWRESNADIFLAPVDRRSGEIRLTEHPANDSSPHWSPDGQSVMFLSERSGSQEVWALRIDPRSGSRVGDAFVLTPLPSRTQILSATISGDMFVAHRKRSVRVLFVPVNPTNGVIGQPAVSTLPEETWNPGWSPDGSKLHFVASRSLIERNLVTQEDRTIRLPAFHGSPLAFRALSPDGRSVTFFGEDSTKDKGFYEYSRATGEIVWLWRFGDQVNPPISWSRDGQKLLFAGLGTDGRHHIRVLDRSASQPVTVGLSWSSPFPQWSPDGTFIGYTDRHCLMVIPSAGGTPRAILCAAPTALPGFDYLGVGALSWSPDGRKLAWTVNNGERRRVEIWIVDRATGDHTTWPGEDDYKAWPRDLQWSPDGRQLALTMDYKREYEILRVAGVLPRESAGSLR